MTSEQTSSASTVVGMNATLQSPSVTSRKSSSSRREPTRACKPHPCMANMLPATPRHANSERSNASERGRRCIATASPSPSSESSIELISKHRSPPKDGKTSRRDGPRLNERRLYEASAKQPGLDSQSSDEAVALECSRSKQKQSRCKETPSEQRDGDSLSTEDNPLECDRSTQKPVKSRYSAKNDRMDRQEKFLNGTSKASDSNAHRPSRVKTLLERSQSERYPSKTSTFHDSDTFTLESNYDDGQDAKPFLQLCFDGLDDIVTSKEDELQNSGGSELELVGLRRRGPPSRAMSLRNLIGSGSSPGGLNGKDFQSPSSSKIQSSLDRRKQLQKSKSVSLRAVECTSVREMTNIITSDIDDHFGSTSNSSTIDETPSPSASSFPYEPSVGGDDTDDLGGYRAILSSYKPAAAGLFKSLSLSHAKSSHGISSNSLHNETARVNHLNRSSHKKLNVKGVGDTFSLLSHKLFAASDGDPVECSTHGNRKKVWGSSSERRDRPLSAALQGLATKSFHEQQGSRRSGLKRIESTTSVNTYAASVISCSTIDRRSAFERSKSTTSIASFSITPSLRGQNSEHLRSVNAFVYDSAKPLTKESRESLHALLTDTIDFVTHNEAPAVLEKYRGVSGDELVELMKNFSEQLNDTMSVC